MIKSISDNAKRRGRPKTTGTGQVVGVRLHPDQLAALDAWRAKQPDLPTRPEAIRRLISHGLAGEGAPAGTAKPAKRKRRPAGS